ncbi:hypothetical protein Cni_G25837 [Canna indica]|uniref:CS domain-containing protein n=1 Tax=Canna indica TaxID=4628 RepID=A0AAQ3L1V3_9LILI|nr:hypothetical protein Cni_G25837 [Canna indica]
MVNEQQLRVDLEELRSLESIIKRPRVVSLIASEIRQVEAKICVFLGGVNEEKVETIFKPMSVDIKFHDIQGKNYRCTIPKLNKEIVPEKCKLVVKSTKVIITLFKASKGNWLDLHFKEDMINIIHDSSTATRKICCLGGLDMNLLLKKQWNIFLNLTLVSAFQKPSILDIA